jgi:DNA-binding transcriptional LysR family regulator
MENVVASVSQNFSAGSGAADFSPKDRLFTKMNLRRLHYFMMVAEEQNFGRAAEKIGISQPPLSQQIQLLERELGTKLFRRGSGKVELTDAGRVLLQGARSLEEGAEQTVLNVERARRGEVGRLVVGFTAAASYNSLIPAAIGLFRDTCPSISLKLCEGVSESLLEMLFAGEADVILSHAALADRQRVMLEPLVDEAIVAVLPAGHPLAAANSVELSALVKEPFVLYPRRFTPVLHDLVVAACQDMAASPRVTREAPAFSTAINFVAAGFGVSLVPASLQQLCMRDVTYRPLSGSSLRVSLNLICRRGETNMVVRNFINAARRAVSRNEREATTELSS